MQLDVCSKVSVSNSNKVNPCVKIAPVRQWT